MDKNRKITYIDGKFTVYGKELTMLDGMYCLNDLFSAMDEQGIERLQFGQYVRKKSFLRLIWCYTGIRLRNSKFVVSKLCEKGLMKRSGRREEAKLYASLPIMWCILTDYNDTLTKDAADVLVLNRSFNSAG